MALRPARYRSLKAQNIADPATRMAFEDMAQKIEQLARDAENRVAGLDAVPAGTVVMWFGAVADIPAGWSEVVAARGRFFRHMLSGGTPLATGGSEKHTHGTGGSGAGGGKTSTYGPTGGGVSMKDGTGAARTLSLSPHDHDIPEATAWQPYIDGILIQKD